MLTLYTLIIFSENLAGVLSAITNTFTRRQLNIESLNVSTSGTEGIHRYTITCYSDATTISTIVKQIEKKIDVIQARYFTAEEIYVMEQALYKISTPHLLKNKTISKAIRTYDGKLMSVNPTYTIVSKEGTPEEVTALYEHMKETDCLLQFVRSGIVAVTKSHREELTAFLDMRQKQRITPNK